MSVADRGPGIPASDLDARVRQVLPRPARAAPCRLPHRFRTGTGRLQGAGRGAWWAHLGRSARGRRSGHLRGVAS